MPENSQNSPVLVVGATGFLGMEICQQLVNARKKVKALVRASSDPAKVKALQQLGVETSEGDLKNPASIKIAMNGVGSVISTASSTFSRQQGDSIESVDNDGQINLVQTAKDAGVERFIFISFYPMSENFPLQTSKRNVEKKLIESKMNYTILQPGFFMEIWLSAAVGFDFQHSKATIYGEGKNKLSWISLKDVAKFAVASLDNKAARNSVFQLGGPEPLSPLEVVKIFENHVGNGFTTEQVPVAALRGQKTAATDSLGESFAGLMLAYAEGDNIDMKETRKVYPFRLTSVTEYAQQVPVEQAV
ncbi:MAG TPA: SDR family oxidoreductase [Puia sp.]|nr:SDR family oxidoreductase [Puia sp.]